MGIFNRSKDKQERVVLDMDQVEKVKQIKGSKDRVKTIKKYPSLLPFVLRSWSDDPKFAEIVKTGISYYPENIAKLGKAGVVPTEELVAIAIKSKPSIIFSLNKDIKDMITKDAFFSAFVKDPDICASDAKVLRKVIKRKAKVNIKGEEQEKLISTTVRSECLKALRLASGVSRYHQGFDDVAIVLAEQLTKNKVLKKYNTKEILATKLPTLVNILIKTQNIKIYSLPAEVWKLNNYKTLYYVVKESFKDNSKIGDVLEYLPFDLLPEKVTKKVVALALSKDPEIWNRLADLNLEKYKNNAYIQYVEYKSCKEHKREDLIANLLTEKEIKTASSKYSGMLKRKSNEKIRRTNAKIENIKNLKTEVSKKEDAMEL